MNICFFTSEYPSPRRGGVERVTYTLFCELKARGHRVFIVSRDAPLAGDVEQLAGVYELPPVGRKQYIERFFRCHEVEVAVNQSHHAEIGTLLTEIRQELPVSVISVIHSDPLCVLKGIRDDFDLYMRGCRFWKSIVFPYAMLRSAVRWFLRRRCLREAYRKQYANSDAVVLLSERSMADYMGVAGVEDGSHLFAISNPVELAATCPTLDAKEKIVLFVGRMCYAAKRPDRMISIWQRIASTHPDWMLYMLGDGPERKRLEALCAEKKIPNVIFTGTTNPAPYYERASILCMTSTYEGFGLVLIEAQQHGCVPMAYASYAALADLIEDEHNGYAIPPFCETKYAQRLSALMEDAGRRKKLARNSGRVCAAFRVERIVHQWEELFIRIRDKHKEIDSPNGSRCSINI